MKPVLVKQAFELSQQCRHVFLVETVERHGYCGIGRGLQMRASLQQTKTLRSDNSEHADVLT